MAVYKQTKTSKIWWYSFVWRGERIQESTRQTNKRVAQQIESARQTQLAKGEVGIKDRPQVPTLRQFAEGTFLPYIRTLKAGKPATVAFYTQRCSRLIEAMADTKLDAFNTSDITAYVEARRKAKMAVATVNRDLATLRRMLKLAVAEGVIPHACQVKRLPDEATRERVLTHAEESLYLSAATPLLYAIAVIMMDCDPRPDEIHRLRWADNIRHGAIEIHTGKTGGARRTIPTTERVDALLTTLARDTEWVFPALTKSGHISVDTYKKAHAKAIAKIGPFVPYSLRHTCMTRWARSGMSVPTLKYLAGHRNIATTMRYTHLAGTDAGAELAEARKRMSGVVMISTMMPNSNEA
jgi:integrase